jgi:hypothetical protein
LERSISTVGNLRPDEVDLPLLRAVVDEDFHQQLARGTRSPPRDGRFTQDDIRSQAVHRYFETRVIISEKPGLSVSLCSGGRAGQSRWQHYLAALLDDLFSSFMEGCLVGVGAFGTFAVPEVLRLPWSSGPQREAICRTGTGRSAQA